MIRILPLHEAEKCVTELIQAVLAFKDVIITKKDKPSVRMFRYEELTTPRKGGQLAGMVRIDDDFDAPLPLDIQKSFDGTGD